MERNDFTDDENKVYENLFKTADKYLDKFEGKTPDELNSGNNKDWENFKKEFTPILDELDRLLELE